MSRQLSNSPLQILGKLADEFGLHDDKSDRLLRSLSLRPERQTRAKSFLRLNSRKVSDVMQSGIPIRKARQDVDLSGDIYIGEELLTGRQTGVNFSELLKLGAIYAASGFYKSVTLLNIAAQLIRVEVPVVIIDEKGRQFRSLQRAFPDRVLVMKTDGKFPFNPFSLPRGCSPSVYYPGLVEIRSAVYQRQDSSNLFEEILFRELEKYGNGFFPCEQDLHNATVTTRFRKGYDDYHARRFRLSLVTVSTGIVRNSFGKTLGFRKDLDFVDVLEKGFSLVIEASNLQPQDLEYLLAAVKHKFHTILRSRAIAPDELRLVFLIDEGSEQFREREGIPPLIDLGTKQRQSGIGEIIGMHAPHLAHSLLRTTTYFTICYRLSSDKAIRTVKDSMFLTPEQAAYIPTQPVRHGIMTLGDRHPAPIALVASEPIIPMDLNIPNEEVELRNQAILKTLPQVVPWQGQLLTLTEPGEAATPTVSAETSSISADEWRLLDYWLTAFDSTATQVYKALDWNIARGDKVVDSIVKKGLAVSVSLNPSGKRGRCVFLWHTDKYFQMTGRQKPITGTDGKGAEHCVMLRFLHKKLKSMQGCSSVEIGRAFESARCDLFFRYADAGYCVEAVSTTLKTESEKLSKMLKHPDVKAAFAIANKVEMVKALREELKGLDRVVVLKFSEFLNTGIEELVAKTTGGRDDRGEAAQQGDA